MTRKVAGYEANLWQDRVWAAFKNGICLPIAVMNRSKLPKCTWCGKRRRKWSDYEQQCLISGRWHRICTWCLNRREKNPWSGLFHSGLDGLVISATT